MHPVDNLDVPFCNKDLVNLACCIPKSVQQKVLECVGRKSTVHSNIVDEVQELSDACQISVSKLQDLIGLYILLLKLHLQCSSQHFAKTLISLGFNTEFVDNFRLLSDIARESSFIDSNLIAIEKLTNLKWRVDISISSGVISKSLPPIFIINLQLSSGKTYTLEVDIKTFHTLRYIVSVALNEFIALKNYVLKTKPFNVM